MKCTSNQTVNNKLIIGSVKLNSRVIQAPLAGYSDTVFRNIIRMFDKHSLLTSEMVSSEALIMNQDKSIIDFVKYERPLSFQLSGHKPDKMATAAKMLENIATIIDINMGCPASKIVSNADGAKLMTDLKLASEIISSVKNAVSVPVTVKCRLGWDHNSKNYLKFAKMAENSGADAICIHGRTRSQLYSGVADWLPIKQVKETVNIPVIANGDITTPQKAKECLDMTGCDGISVGRGVLADPSLTYRIDNFLKTGSDNFSLSSKKSLELLLLHLKKETEYRGDIKGVKFFRKFIGWYVKGIDGASGHRFNLVRMNNYSEIDKYVKNIIKS